MADRIPFTLYRWMNGRWAPCAPGTDAAVVDMPDGVSLSQYLRAREADRKWLTVTHNLGGYPLVLLLSLQYGAGMGGAGIGPAGGTDLIQVPCRAVYHSQNSLTVYTVPSVVELGTPVIKRTNDYEHLITFDGINANSLYMKLILNMGNMDEIPARLYLKQVDQGGI